MLFLFIDLRFIAISIIGNLLVFIIAGIMFYIESPVNPKLITYVDSLWWSFSTITTVGYGDIVPVTNSGKYLGMISMIIGTGIFATYTGLFAQVFLRDIEDLNSKHLREDLHKIKRELHELRKSRD